MSTVSSKSWDRYINALRKLSDKATKEMEAMINTVGMDSDEAIKQLISYGFNLATKYGEGSASLAAEMYDALSELAGKVVSPAVPAATATYGEVAKAVYGTRLQSQNPEVMAGSIGRLVKMAGADTMQQNAIRDGAYWAWIPRGDTCAFCLTLASRGWQKASKKALKNGHAEHIHANCDCTYAIRFGDDLVIEGYDPDMYKEMYDNAEGATPKDKINYMRRQFYAENKGLKLGADAEEFVPKISTIRRNLEVDKVAYNPPKKLSNILSDDSIIAKIGGGDETKGSCVSSAFAFIGNKGGWDVLDFRGGTSQFHFAKVGPMCDFLESIGGTVIKKANDFKIATDLIKEIKENKLYILGLGKHTAIVRKVGNAYEYLELQTNNNNGFKRLTTDILKKRFGCKKTHTLYGMTVDSRGYIADIELLINSPEFEELLGYINTLPGDEKIGVLGYAK